MRGCPRSARSASKVERGPEERRSCMASPRPSRSSREPCSVENSMRRRTARVPAHRCRDAVETKALSSKATVPLIESSAFGREKWRMRPSVIVALPENTGCPIGPFTAARQIRAARSAHVLEEPLEDGEVCVARHLQPDAIVHQADATGDAHRVSSQASCRSRRVTRPDRAPAEWARRSSPSNRTSACQSCRSCPPPPGFRSRSDRP